MQFEITEIEIATINMCLEITKKHITIKVNYRNGQCDQNLNTAEYIRDNDRNSKRNQEHGGTTDTIQIYKIAHNRQPTQPSRHNTSQ